ncbi:MAG: VOC family protein, partial [Blastocatellia bacterium]
MPIRISILFLTLCLCLPAGRPQTPDAVRFHHVHLNTTDPGKTADFYTRTFDVTKKTTLAGFAAVQSEDMYLLFDKAGKPPLTAPDSAIWHFGWGSTAMETDYQKHLTSGVSFATPLTRLNPNLLFAYMKGPDGALIEINTANTRAFIHTHLYSAAPLCAAEWYVRHLGAASRSTGRAPREGPCEVPFAAPSEPLGVIRAPATSVRFGDISLIIYPQQRPAPLVSPRGHAVDHIALSVPDLAGTLDRLQKENVKVLEKIHPFGKSKTMAAMIEGPDTIAIELVE